MKHYDVLVIGTGGGTKIALPAASMGFKTALVERDAVGGTCPNRGCIPSKMLIYPTTVPLLVREARRIDVTSSGDLGVRFPDMVGRIAKTVHDLSARLRSTIDKTPNLDFYPVHARFMGDRVVRAGDEPLTAKRIFIATGSCPRIPDISGLADTPFMTSREALSRADLPRRLLVIGGGYIAVELGGAYAGAGAEVEFIVRSRLLRQEDRDVGEAFALAFGEAHTVHQGLIPVHVAYQDGTFAVTCSGGSSPARVLTGDALLVATGVTPCTRDLGIETTGVRLDEAGFIRVGPCLDTEVEGVYALGDCVGHYLFRHTVNYEGEYLVRTVLRGEHGRPIDYGPVPHAVFGDPEVAAVGLTEQQAAEREIDYVVGRASYEDSNAGLARGYRHGFVKVLIERPTRRILGAHILGPEASDMIHVFVAMMKKQGTLDDLLGMIFIHPALAEVARDAARDADLQFQGPGPQQEPGLRPGIASRPGGPRRGPRRNGPVQDRGPT